MPKGIYKRIERSHDEAVECLLARLFDRSEFVTESGCLIWLGAVNENGYGIIAAPKGLNKGRNGKCLLTHRAMWIAIHGSLRSDEFVLHRCDVAPCCNPNHLYIGDQAQNMRDAVNRSRFPTGSKRKHSKLTEQDVLKIKASSESGCQIAVEMGVHPNTIYDIRKGRYWRHV